MSSMVIRRFGLEKTPSTWPPRLKQHRYWEGAMSDGKKLSKSQSSAPQWEHDLEQPDTLVANVRWIGQLICRNRKAHCRHTNLSEPT